MKLFSESGDRIESRLNKILSNIIPIVYGAVISYSMYVFSRILIGLLLLAKKSQTNEIPFNEYEPYIYSFVIFICIWLFLIQEIGSIYKLSEVFPYKRTSRYTYEMWIATLYVAAFTFLEINSYVTVLMFSFILILGGLWCNQFKEEYLGSPGKIDHLMRTESNLYYFGGFSFLAQFSVFVLFYKEVSFHHSSTLFFLLTFILFQLLIALIPYVRHGKYVLGYSINIVIPDQVFTRAIKIQSKNN